MNYCIPHVGISLCNVMKLQLKNDGTTLCYAKWKRPVIFQFKSNRSV
jgi:hypothetical protein